MIRRATQADIPALVELGRQEHAGSFMASTPFDANHVALNFAQLIGGFHGVVFVSCDTADTPTGVIAGMAQPNLHNRYSTVYELMWFATDGAGIKLLDALKTWANRMRATRMVVHNYAGQVASEKFTRAMGRKGLMPLGMAYTIQLEN